jgi:hypothetical protein
LKINGVDVTDPTRNFSAEEWRRLRESGFLSWLFDRRSALNRTGAGGRAGRGGPGARGGRGNDDRHVTIGATEVIHYDGQQAANPNANEDEHQGGGRAGAGFGAGRYATGRGRGGRR